VRHFVAAVQRSDDVAFLHGDGNGGFAAPTRSALPATPGYLAVGDLNLDGSLDLVTASVVMLGRGDGTFVQAGSYGSGGSVAVADVNRDGRPDVLVIDQYANLALRVLLGNGDGSLTSAGSYYAAAATNVTVADVNHDGKPDAVILGYDRAVAIMLGNGDGTFAVGTKTTIPYSAPSVAVVDFDRDGHLDLITNSQYSDGSGVSLLLGRGDGTFREPHNYALGVSSGDVITGDLNRDGMTDIVVISNTTAFAVGFGK
jgi:hypothetical protein